MLYNFCTQTNCTDGSIPFASLIFDAAGNLYGTTQYGGTHCWRDGVRVVAHSGRGLDGDGAAQLLPQTVARTGLVPCAGLIFDAAGNLYGTTHYGGTYRYGGTVFELTPTAGGGWTETVLYSFSATARTGLFPSPA